MKADANVASCWIEAVLPAGSCGFHPTEVVNGTCKLSPQARVSTPQDPLL